MGKSAMLSDQAYSALKAAKRSEAESLSQVILRHVPKPIRTFGDLEKHLKSLEGPIIADTSALARLRARKAKGRAC